MDKKWDMLLAKFRKLGGIADNVVQKQGEFGRGIFSINPNDKSRIYIPLDLMVNQDDVCLKDKKIRIKKEIYYSSEIRDFFNFYQDNFSWGGGGQEVTESFEKGLSLFHTNLKELIKKFFLVDIEKRHIGDWDQVILTQFLGARVFRVDKSDMICPILELVNHETISLPFNFGLSGIKIHL